MRPTTRHERTNRAVALVVAVAALLAATAALKPPTKGSAGAPANGNAPSASAGANRRDTAQQASFKVLTQRSKRPPHDVRAALEREPAPGLDLRAAVAVPLPASISPRPAWIAPGNDSLCLYVPDTEGGATTCQPTKAAIASKLMIFLLRGQTQTIIGVAPDDVAAAHILATGGQSATALVHHNLYAIQTRGAETLAVGSTITEIPSPPRVISPAVPPPA